MSAQQTMSQAEAAAAAASISYRSDSMIARWRASLWKFARNKPLGAASASVMVVLVFTAIFADIIAPFPPLETDVGPSLVSPSSDHLLGTDQFGRDIFSRIVHGARISLYVGLGATLIAALLATTLGAMSGYLGGALDLILQRFVDTAQAIPGLVLLIGLMIVLGPSITNVIIAVSFRYSLALSRVTRGAVIGIRNTPFIEAARAIGASQPRVFFRHVIPNIFPTVIVLVSTSVGVIIVIEASLSFLGYGVPAPAPSWGGMMSSDGRTYMLIAPWMLIAPTVALSLVVFSANMFGDALRDVLDPRLRGTN